MTKLFLPPTIIDEEIKQLLTKPQTKTMDKFSEKDPHKIDKHAPGAKLDDGKILADDILRMFSRALWAVCEVGTRGAAKYSLGGWQYVNDGKRRYANAQMRHKLKEWSGEEYDPDPEIKTLHAAQDIWNGLARLELILREKEERGEEWRQMK